jgi:CPA1 family monovalent cation:H+ antiporter
MFVLLGEQLLRIVHGAVATLEQSGHRNPAWLLVYAVAVTLGLALLRLLWVWISLRYYAARRRRAGDPLANTGWRVVLATTLAGVRGAITLAGILTLPFLLPDGRPFPVRDLAIFIAAAVIILSLAAASIGLPPLLRGLHQPLESGAGQEADHARALAAHAAINAVRSAHQEMQQSMPGDAGISAGAASRVITLYRRRIHDGMFEDTDAERLRRSDAIERKLRLVALEHERKEILAMTLSHRISEETSRRLLRDLDLVEMLYR